MKHFQGGGGGGGGGMLCIGNASKMCTCFALDNECVNPSKELRIKTIMADLCLVYVHVKCQVV